MNKLFIVAVFALILLFSMNLSAQDKPMYVGVAKCKACHGKMTGDQYGTWEEGPHANALKSLSSEKALKYAEENNIEDPANNPKCLNCHATIKTVDEKLIDPKGKLTLEEGVSCESCHGPGSEYKSPKIMSRKAYKEDPQAAQKAAMEVGLILPTEEVCVTCHNENNPFHEPFNYEEMAKQIAHPVPEDK